MDLSNPFAHSIVTDAWQPAQSDVPVIHANVYDLCGAVLEQVRQSGGSRSVLLHGLPGSGKTHLLARFRTSLTGTPPESGPTVTLPVPPTVLFIAVRLRAGARMLCRHLRRTLATDLFRPTRLGMSQLEQLLLYRLSQHLKDRKKAQRVWQALRQPPRTRWYWPFGPPEEISRATREVEGLIEHMDEQATLGRNLATALRHLALGRHRRDVRDWLHDGVLPDAAIRDLGLVQPAEDEDPEEQALDLVCAFSRLADSSVPLVLCFDQLEALQTSPDDREGLYAFGKMASALRDKTRNTLIISCVQTAFLDELDHIIRGADMDRLAEKEGLLKPLSHEEAERLVLARVDASPVLADMRRSQQANRVWPLKPSRLMEFLQSTSACTPRQLLSFCDDEFEKWYRGQARPVASLEEFLAVQYQLELEQALQNNQPEQSDGILAHGLPLLMRVLGRGRQVMDHDLRCVDVIFDTPTGHCHLGFCNQAGNQFTGKLSKLRELVEHGRLPQLVLVRDERLPISRYAKKAQEHLDALAERDVPLLRPSASELTALEAFSSLLSDAKAGDLAKRGEVITAAEAERWFATHLPEPLHDLVQALFPTRRQGSRDALYDDLLEFLQDHRVVPLCEAAEQLSRSEAEIQACVSRYSDRFGLLQGPPAVIFEAGGD
ncbi:MAG: AAA family ATPase [Gammaproteobacteria bacterium]